MSNIRAVIVDDEIKAQKVLETILFQEVPEIDIIGTASNVENAIELINKKKPNLIFLDISLADGTGFDILEQIDYLDTDIIFVTSHDNYMMKAIQFCAIGYVLKPIDRSELVKAIQNAKNRLEKKYNQESLERLKENVRNPGNHNRIGIPTSDSVEFIPVCEIVRCEGFEGYTKVIIQQHKNIVSSYNVGEFRHLLESYGFLDIHKSHLINPEHIVRYDNEGMVTLTDQSTVPVSRRKRTEFLSQLKRL